MAANIFLRRRASLSFFFVFTIACVLGLSSCAVPRIGLPSRELQMKLYTDGTCEYEFEGIQYGQKKPWNMGPANPNNPQGAQLLVCEPSVFITMTEQFQNTSPVKTDAGHLVFQPEYDRSSRKNKRNKSFALVNNYRWSAWVSVFVLRQSGTDANIEFQTQELFFPCDQYRFESTDNPKNQGVIYSESHQASSGIYMELTTEVKSTGVGC